MGKNNPELWKFFPELLNWFYSYSSHILVWNLVPLFSGQDDVRTSNLIASVTMWHSAFKSHALYIYTTLKIDRDCHFLDRQFTLSITIAYHHSSPKHRLRLFEVVPSYIELYLRGLHTHSSIVRLNSLVHWTTVSALLGSHLLRWHVAG